MSMQLQHLIDQVNAVSDAEKAAVILILDLADKFAQASADQVKVDQLAAQLKAVAQELGAAVVANTPATAAPPI